MKKILNEEADREIINGWYDRAGKIKPGELSDFLDELANGYVHDYGTACHAMAAAGIAAMWAMNETLSITGFQASLVMWCVIRNWTKRGNKTGLKLVDYDNMLYPQYKDRFEKTIDPATWEAIQKEAKRHLDELDADKILTDDDVVGHWRSIAEGTPPFGYIVREEE